MRAWWLAALLAPGVASGQGVPTDPARLELIAQAEAASAAGDHAAALSLGGRAAALRMTPSLMVFLAREHRDLGHWVEALDLARQCLRAADADVALRNRAVILQACEAVRARAEPRVAHLAIACDAPPSDLSLRVGSRELPATLLDVEVPVTPGEVRVTASAPGFEPFDTSVTLTEGARGRVALRLVRTPPAVAPPAPAPTPQADRAVAAAPLPPAPLAPPSRRAASRAPGAGPWLLGGGALVAGALAGVFYGLALTARGERDAACDATGCLPSSRESDARYGDQLMVGNAAVIAGASLLVGAAVWYVVARVSSPRTTAQGSVGALVLRF